MHVVKDPTRAMFEFVSCNQMLKLANGYYWCEYISVDSTWMSGFFWVPENVYITDVLRCSNIMNTDLKHNITFMHKAF